MKYAKIIKQKDRLFNQFIDEYGHRLKMVQHVFDYLSTYPVVQDLFKGTIINPEQLFGNQKDWVYQCSMLKESPEKEFFKSYYAPLNEEFDFFIDLSNKKLPIYQLQHDCLKVRNFYKVLTVPDISNFMLELNDASLFSANLAREKLFHPNYFNSYPNVLFKANEPMNPNNYLEGSKPIIKMKNDTIIGSGFHASIIELFNFYATVTIDKVIYENDPNELHGKSDETYMLHMLATHLQINESFDFDEIAITFPDYADSWLRYKQGKFEFKHKNSLVLKYIKDSLKQLVTSNSDNKINHMNKPA